MSKTRKVVRAYGGAPAARPACLCLLFAAALALALALFGNAVSAIAANASVEVPPEYYFSVEPQLTAFSVFVNESKTVFFTLANTGNANLSDFSCGSNYAWVSFANCAGELGGNVTPGESRSVTVVFYGSGSGGPGVYNAVVSFTTVPTNSTNATNSSTAVVTVKAFPTPTPIPTPYQGGGGYYGGGSSGGYSPSPTPKSTQAAAAASVAPPAPSPSPSPRPTMGHLALVIPTATPLPLAEEGPAPITGLFAFANSGCVGALLLLALIAAALAYYASRKKKLVQAKEWLLIAVAFLIPFAVAWILGDACAAITYAMAESLIALALAFGVKKNWL